MPPEKKFMKKTLEIKTLVKKSQFSEVLGQNATENKVLSFQFLGLFFHRTFLVPKIRTLFPKTFFQRTFFWRLSDILELFNKDLL